MKNRPVHVLVLFVILIVARPQTCFGATSTGDFTVEMVGKVTYSSYTFSGLVMPGWTFNEDFYYTILNLSVPGPVSGTLPSGDFTYHLTGASTVSDGVVTLSGSWTADGTIPASGGASAQTITGSGTFGGTGYVDNSGGGRV